MITGISTGMDVWILAGQSNMEGAACLEGGLAPDPRVHCLNSNGCWKMAEEPIHRDNRGFSDADLADPLLRSRLYGAGPGLAFGIAMAEFTGRDVGLIPVARGGTKLEQWDPSGKADGTASLYGNMLHRARLAGGNLRGILWYQGESDAAALVTARTYAERLEAWIAAARADLNRPELLVVVVQVSRRAMGTLITPALATGWDLVRAALLNLPLSVPYTAVVGSIDLGLSDTVHLDTASQIRMGRRLAMVAQRMESMPASLCSPRVERVEAVPEQLGLGGLRLRCTGVTGNWQPAQRIAGFGIYQADGLPHPDCWLINASRDPEDGTAIRLLLNKPADATVWVGYGRGADPYCNVVDASDMPLSAFISAVEAEKEPHEKQQTKP